MNKQLTREEPIRKPLFIFNLSMCGFASTMVIGQTAGKGSLTSFGNKWGWSGANEAFIPQLVMYADPPFVYNDTTKVNADIDTFLVQHGFNGFHLKIYCRWFDLDQEDCSSIVGSNPSIDIRTFLALEELITRTHAAGGMVHIWMWGDDNLNPSVRPDWGGLGGPVEMSLLGEIANRLGSIPGWTLGYGFDISEWATQAQATVWHDSLQSFLPQVHFLGARPIGPNTGTNHTPFIPWNQKFDYSSYEHHKPTYDVYVAALDALTDRPVMSEDRFRIRIPPGAKDYTPDETRWGLWNSTMAGGMANIWGNLTNGGSHETGSAPYPNRDQIKTYSLFFEKRFTKDMIQLTDGNTRELMRPTNAHYVFYGDSTASIQMDLSSMISPQPAVAVDARLTYVETSLDTLNSTVQTWDAPYTSDSAIAVGDFNPNQAPIADAGPDQIIENINTAGTEPVTLDGSASLDPNDFLVSYVWTEGGTPIATGVNPTVVLNVGVHPVDLTVTDNQGAKNTAGVTINTASRVFRVERTTGDVFAKGAFIGGGADLAERINISEPVEPGDVIELDPTNPTYYRKARGEKNLLAGVITTEPGFILGNNSTQIESDAQNTPLLALMGRVPVKVTTENGAIRPGDLLTVASRPGYAMRCSDGKKCDGAILGKALQGLYKGEGKILALVMSH